VVEASETVGVVLVLLPAQPLGPIHNSVRIDVGFMVGPPSLVPLTVEPLPQLAGVVGRDVGGGLEGSEVAPPLVIDVMATGPPALRR
jgi:hypothetical protein